MIPCLHILNSIISTASQLGCPSCRHPGKVFMTTHFRPDACRSTLQSAPDTFQTPTIPNPHLYSGGHFRSTEPARLSQFVNEWTPDARAQSCYVGLRSGPSGNSTSSQCSQLTPGLTGWASTSSLHSADASPMTLQRHGTSHYTLPEGNLGHVSQPFPASPLAEQPALTLSNCTEEPTSTSGRTATWQSPKHQSVEPRHSDKQRHYRSCVTRPREQSWRLTASSGTAFQSFNCDINGCRMPFNNSRSLRAHLEMHASSASVFSMNSTDSGYVSVLDVTPLSYSPTNTPDLNASTSPFLSEDILLEFCDMPSTRTQLECDEVTTSSDANLVNGLKDGISFVEGCVPSTMTKVPFHRQLSRWEEAENEWERFLVLGRGACAQVPTINEATTTRTQCRSAERSACSSKLLGDPTTGTNTSRCSEILPRLSTPTLEPGGLSTDPGTTCLGDRVASCPANAEECDEEALATDDEDMDADGHSRAPTPWPERWYEGGSELGLQQFAAKVIADCLGHHGDAEATNDEFGTAQCPADNDAGHHRHEHTGATTTGASSTTGQTTHVGRQSSGGHPTKRPRSSDDGGSEEDRPPKRRDAKGPPDSDANPRKFYACPYQKRNPQQSPLCGMPHGPKRDFGWDNVSRVKQHLLESHGLDHHCRNCWKAYKKVQDARSCHETRKCLQRTSPPKHWLSETQITQLKAERVVSQSDEAWYRIADLLFDNEQDYSPESFRAEHTPYYDRVNHRKPFPDEPSPYRSPDSMWTPASDSTNPPGSTPMPGNQNVAPPTEPAEEGESAPATDPLPHQQARECCGQPGPEAASIVAKEAAEPAVDPEPYRCDNPEAAVAVPAIASTHGYTTPETTSYFLSEQLLHASTAQDFDADELEQFFHFGSAAADPSQPHLAELRPATPAAAACEALHQFTDTAAVEQSSLACSCGHAQKCICRLKKRVADLRSENESLWAEKETMRKALVGLRQTLERQDELLQLMEEKGLLPGEAMGKLWEYQDKMRAVVLEHR